MVLFTMLKIKIKALFMKLLIQADKTLAHGCSHINSCFMYTHHILCPERQQWPDLIAEHGNTIVTVNMCDDEANSL